MVPSPLTMVPSQSNEEGLSITRQITVGANTSAAYRTYSIQKGERLACRSPLIPFILLWSLPQLPVQTGQLLLLPAPVLSYLN